MRGEMMLFHLCVCVCAERRRRVEAREGRPTNSWSAPRPHRSSSSSLR